MVETKVQNTSDEKSRVEKQREHRDKWDKANMAYQTVKVRKELLDEFRSICKRRGDPVNTVLKTAMEEYIAMHKEEEA